MVLDSKTGAKHNAMLGRKIQHPTSTKFYDELPPTKRLKTFESTDGEQEESYNISGDEGGLVTPSRTNDEIPTSDTDNNINRDDKPSPPPTDLESALPSVKTDKDAIADYEAMKAAEQAESGDLQSRLNKRNWTGGKSSIYVDAFNLALDTVLADEGYLFSEKEMEVFSQWRSLEYEAQYL